MTKIVNNILTIFPINKYSMKNGNKLLVYFLYILTKILTSFSSSFLSKYFLEISHDFIVASTARIALSKEDIILIAIYE